MMHWEGREAIIDEWLDAFIDIIHTMRDTEPIDEDLDELLDRSPASVMVCFCC